MFIDSGFSDSDDMDDDDEICFICDHIEVNNGMELLLVWTQGKREWSNIKNVKQDCPNFDKGIQLESSKRKRI